MAKLEELTSLLVDEIEEFKHSVDKLEKIKTQLKSTKIKMDLTEYRGIMETHQQKIQNHQNSIEYFDKQMEAMLKNAKIYPTWAVILIVISLLFGIVSFVYSYNVNRNVNLLEKEAFNKGVADSNNFIQPFFDSHPISDKAFEI